MTHLFSLAATPLVDTTSGFGLSKALIMSITCLVILLITSRSIKYPHVGPKMPLGPLGPVFNNISVAGFIGAMSFGHILGTILIRAFANAFA